MADDADLKNTDTASDRGSSEDRGGGSERHDRSLDRNEHRDRGRSIRDELRASFDEAVERDERYSKKSEPSGRAARAAKEATDTNQPTDAGAAAAPGARSRAAAAPDISAPPKSWRNDEKRHYNSLPPAIKNAVHRRETEMEPASIEIKKNIRGRCGVGPILTDDKQHWERPAANGPNILAGSSTPSKSPTRISALVRKDGRRRAFQAHLQRQQAQPQAQQRSVPAICGDRRAALDRIPADHRAAGGSTGEAHANAIIDEWKKGKEHFETVRAQMANMVRQERSPCGTAKLTSMRLTRRRKTSSGAVRDRPLPRGSPQRKSAARVGRPRAAL